MANEKIVNRENLKAFRQALQQKIENGAIVAGKSLTTKQIENVSDESGSYQTKPFTLQATGTDSNTSETSTAPVAKHLELRGQTYVLNQQVAKTASTEEINGITFTNNGDGSWTLSGVATDDAIKNLGNSPSITGHKYLYGFKNLTSAISGVTMRDQYTGNNTFTQDIFTGLSGFATWQSAIKVLSGTDLSTPVTVVPQRYDLTKMFGAGKEPTTVLEFNRLFSLPYYAYNESELVSSKSSKLTNIGYNQFYALDTYINVIAGQTYRLMYLNDTTLANITSGSVKEYDGDKNLIKTTTYSDLTDLHTLDASYPDNGDKGIKLTDNTYYVQISGVSHSYILFNIAWDGTRSDYKPYEKHEYSLPNIELRSNQATGTYDQINANGEKIERVGYRDYVSGDESNASVTTDGVHTVYDLTTPSIVQTTTFAENIEVDDFGTMEFDSVYPQGNRFFYPADYVLLLDDLNEYVNGDVTELAKTSEISSLLGGSFNVINESDIVSNTLTQEQYDLITNGKPTLINGTGTSSKWLFSGIIDGANYIAFAINLIYGNANLISYSIPTTGTHNFISNVGANTRLHINGNQFNGKTIPAYPSSTGTFVLKCVDGTLTWVAE